MASRLLVYYSLWGPINGRVLVIGFMQILILRWRLLHHPFALQELYIIALF